MKKIIPIIFGVKGLEVSSEEREFFKKNPPLGFILFARNIESREQVSSLTSELQALSTEKLILIDQEGGRVCRLKYPLFRECPQAKYFGDMYHEHSPDKALKEVYENYYNLTKELLKLGINVNCVPVADLLHKGAHDIIGNRAFSDKVDVVVELCSKVIQATLDAGGIPIMKHIPGHGRAMLDSHHDLPYVDTDLKILEETDFAVFKKLSNFSKNNSHNFAMTAHIVYSCLDDKNPATMSPAVIKYIREKIGFTGRIMTDDFSMKALSGDFASRAQQALVAGCDILLHCNGEMSEMVEIVESL